MPCKTIKFNHISNHVKNYDMKYIKCELFVWRTLLTRDCLILIELLHVIYLFNQLRTLRAGLMLENNRQLFRANVSHLLSRELLVFSCLLMALCFALLKYNLTTYFITFVTELDWTLKQIIKRFYYDTTTTVSIAFVYQVMGLLFISDHKLRTRQFLQTYMAINCIYCNCNYVALFAIRTQAHD